MENTFNSPQKAHPSSNLETEGQSSEQGKSMAPPAFQLKASSLSDLVSPVSMMARNEAPVQRVALNDFNDSNPLHDPSHVTDADIKGTDEYQLLLGTHNRIPTTDPTVLYTEAEILLACRLMLRALREGTAVDAAANGVQYLDRARMQIGTAGAAENLDNSLNWSATFPGSNNTDFGNWLLNGGPKPASSTSVMNCWELVMFSAHEAGFATEAGLRNVYQQFATNLGTDVDAAVTQFENALRQGNEQVFDPSDPNSPRPLQGDIVIFNSLAAHVAIATGGDLAGSPEIMSLWTQNNRHTFRTSVDVLLRATAGPVRFFSPKWS